jgi:hypothetical protein
MGMKDSSETRVVPVFERIYSGDTTGKTWLPRLLCLPTEGNHISISRILEFSIQDKGWGRNEKKLEPPVSLLSWLIRHPHMPANSILSLNLDKEQKRRELIDGSQTRLREALNLLRNNPAKEDWHIFEGKTQPDVFIETPDILVVIEGKRTESETTKYTKWMHGRHQMLRHIDCAWEIKGRKQVFGFFIVEGEGRNPDLPQSWLKQVRTTMSQDAIRSSLPHRGPEEQAAIAGCFAGATTWQRVCAEFGIDWEQLPD